MDFSESTKAVYDRIQKLEPENVSKIIGYLLLQDHGEREMIRLAFSPDNSIQSLVNKAKSELGLSSKPSLVSTSMLPSQFAPFSPASPRSFSFPSTPGVGSSYWESEPENLDSEDYGLENQLRFLSLEDQSECVNSVGLDSWNSYYYPEPSLGPRTSRRSPSLPEFSLKVCHYFNKGYCKHGNNCRYFHGQLDSVNSVELVNDPHLFSPGSLENLELEITEILKSRRGFPVSIASLPMMYYERYGRTLQAQGYLTESQRHGKAGFSLTKLLARLNNRIRLIDRPHGQHSVILAEDVPKYMEYTNERSDPGGIVSGSRQIYLTFPAESTFSEQDVSNYFSNFGTVQDVRIPCQQKRMFGFVTFVSSVTVRQILAKGNPHFVCGARVLVKPYREKPRLLDRKYAEKFQHQMHCNANFLDMDSEIHSKQAEFPSAERFNNFLDIFNHGSSTSEEKTAHLNNSYHDRESSEGLNLPENPFASPIRNGISTVI